MTTNTDRPKARTGTARRPRSAARAAVPVASGAPTTKPSVPEHGSHDVAGQAIERTLEALSVDEDTAKRIQALPHDVGWLLVTAGIVGVVMPGVLGMPFLVLGGLVLWPGTNKRAERWLEGHSPKLFKGSMRQISRFLDDLERRYPLNKRK